RPADTDGRTSGARLRPADASGPSLGRGRLCGRPDGGCPYTVAARENRTESGKAGTPPDRSRRGLQVPELAAVEVSHVPMTLFVPTPDASDNSLYDTLADAVTDGVVRVDSSGRVREINRAASELFD